MPPRATSKRENHQDATSCEATPCEATRSEQHEASARRESVACRNIKGMQAVSSAYCPACGHPTVIVGATPQANVSF